MSDDKIDLLKKEILSIKNEIDKWEAKSEELKTSIEAVKIQLEIATSFVELTEFYMEDFQKYDRGKKALSDGIERIETILHYIEENIRVIKPKLKNELKQYQ